MLHNRMIIVVLILFSSSILASQVVRECHEGANFTSGCHTCGCYDAQLACFANDCEDPLTVPDDFYKSIETIEPPQAPLMYE